MAQSVGGGRPHLTGLVYQSWDFRFSSGWDEKTLEGLQQITGMTTLHFMVCTMDALWRIDRGCKDGIQDTSQTTRATHIVHVNIGRVGKGGKQLQWGAYSQSNRAKIFLPHLQKLSYTVASLF